VRRRGMSDVPSYEGGALTPSDRVKAVLLRVRELTDNATPGEWIQQSDGWTVRARGSQEECAERGPMICSTNKPQVPTEQQVANSELIAESRTLLPRLAEALEMALDCMGATASPEYFAEKRAKIASILDSPGDSVEG
jgi:hypothetical protein